VTGDQGRSVAGILQEAGWEVTGLVRNLESEPAKGECQSLSTVYSAQGRVLLRVLRSIVSVS
jgi:hypothetical protein